MRALASFRAGLGAALVLARGHADGIRLLDVGPADEMAVAGYSFWAAAFCLPAFAALRALEWMADGVPEAPVHGVTLDLLGYAVGWAGFAVLSLYIARMLGRGRLWPRFVTVWNWCNVLQYLALVGATVPAALGLPDLIGEAVWLIAMGWALWLEWFATRAALEISGPMAAGLVILDVMLGAVMAALTGYAT
jgi:hypothetical protein